MFLGGLNLFKFQWIYGSKRSELVLNQVDLWF